MPLATRRLTQKSPDAAVCVTGHARGDSDSVEARDRPVAVYIGVALGLLHARVAWRLIDGPAATPALASGPQATMLFDRHGDRVYEASSRSAPARTSSVLSTRHQRPLSR